MMKLTKATFTGASPLPKVFIFKNFGKISFWLKAGIFFNNINETILHC